MLYKLIWRLGPKLFTTHGFISLPIVSDNHAVFAHATQERQLHGKTHTHRHTPDAP